MSHVYPRCTIGVMPILCIGTHYYYLHENIIHFDLRLAILKITIDLLSITSLRKANIVVTL